MKKILLAGALALIAAPALAADLPRRTAAVAPAPAFAAPIFTWTGFYVGAQAGYGLGKDKWAISGSATDSFSISPAGFVGGLHAGYNWQTGALVLGVEGDVEFSARDKKASRLIAGSTYTLGSDLGWGGSVRLRAGYAVDRALLYVTAGLAGADITQTGSLGATRVKRSGLEFGWTAGAGVEYAIDQNWSARLEYRYTDLGASKLTTTAFGGSVTTKADTTDQTVRVGLSYRFGGAARPVMARY